MKVKINGKEYKSLKEGCEILGINYGYARFARSKSQGKPIEIKGVKKYKIESV